MDVGASDTAERSIPYRQSVDDVVAALRTDARRGLTEDDARRRLEQYGRNELAAEQPVPAWRRFLAQFQDVLVILLLIATAISAGLWFYERDAALPYEAIAILAVRSAQRDPGVRPGVAGCCGGGGAPRNVRGGRHNHPRW